MLLVDNQLKFYSCDYHNSYNVDTYFLIVYFVNIVLHNELVSTNKYEKHIQ